MAKQKITLIDCPYYKEFSSSVPAGVGYYNCWNETGWDDYPCHCQVPGQTIPLCDKKTNGYKRGIFIAKVSKSKLDAALKTFQYKNSLLPENIVKRLDEIEKQLKRKG